MAWATSHSAPLPAERTRRSTARVCVASDSRQPSGLGRQLLDVAECATRFGTVTVLADPATGLLDAATRLDLEGVPLPDDPSAWFVDRGFDLVHVHAGIAWEGHTLVRAAAAGGARVVRTEHLPWLLTDAGQIDEYFATLPAVSTLIAVSHGVADSFVAAGVPADRVVVVQNGADAPAGGLTPRVARPTPADGPTLLHVGRFTPQKRHDLLLRALPGVLRAHPATRLDLVGEGPDRDATRALAEELGVHEHVRFLGTRDDIGALLADADLLVLASDFEGLPLVLLEAMASGLPVVATRVVGVAEVVDDETAWLVDPGNPEGLSAAIVAALADPAERHRRAAAAATRHAALFTRRAMQDRTADVYARELAEVAR